MGGEAHSSRLQLESLVSRLRCPYSITDTLRFHSNFHKHSFFLSVPLLALGRGTRSN